MSTYGIENIAVLQLLIQIHVNDIKWDPVLYQSSTNCSGGSQMIYIYKTVFFFFGGLKFKIDRVHA